MAENVGSKSEIKIVSQIIKTNNFSDIDVDKFQTQLKQTNLFEEVSQCNSYRIDPKFGFTVVCQVRTPLGTTPNQVAQKLNAKTNSPATAFSANPEMLEKGILIFHYLRASTLANDTDGSTSYCVGEIKEHTDSKTNEKSNSLALTCYNK